MGLNSSMVQKMNWYWCFLLLKRDTKVKFHSKYNSKGIFKGVLRIYKPKESCIDSISIRKSKM